jgi:hypothetical protein
VTTPGHSQGEWGHGHESFNFGPVATMVLGAAVGLAFGYLFLTEHGRQFRTRLGPMLDNWTDELRRLRETADKARSAFHEGRDSFAAMRRVTHAPRDEAF